MKYVYQRFASVNASVSLQEHYKEIKLLYQLLRQGMQAEENDFSKKNQHHKNVCSVHRLLFKNKIVSE